MKTQPLGDSSLISSRIAYGCWRIAGAEHPRDVTEQSRANGRRAVAAAFEAGYTLFDNADIYCRGVCETVFGEALKENRGMRERILIATKCGIVFPGDPRPDSPHRYDFSAEHIIGSCEGSLKRIGVERIDLYHLHRPDLLMDPHEVAGAFDKLRRSGKVREFGVSNFSPFFTQTLAQFCPMPLIVNQVEVHLGRLDCFYDGTLDQCLQRNMTPLAWSPLGGGWIASGKVDPANPRHKHRPHLLQTLDEVAKRQGTSRTVIALAWLLKHPSKMIPIVGSASAANIQAAAKADEIDLSREDWYRLLTAARGEPLP
ncbi:MAG TPA: aldo/keto reductase [Tepidisphaeraceae bacterium]|jgi:predicted oxidoreductase|nr:aldo/keto reductase [Tepidisphaeraceae bacterium]